MSSNKNNKYRHRRYNSQNNKPSAVAEPPVENPKPVVKQYFYNVAYADNYHVVKIIDGKIEDSTILAIYELSGYIRALKDDGYVEAAYLPAAEAKVKYLQEQLKDAMQELEETRKNPLDISEEDAMRFGLIERTNRWERY